MGFQRRNLPQEVLLERTYRFSEDLDFTLLDEAQIEDGFLRRALGEVVTWVADESGLAVPADQLAFDIFQNPRGRISCQARIGYRGPISRHLAQADGPR